MPKAAAGYYAVAKGFNPGIYGTWDACESQVTGFPGSRHKKFKTEAEAAQWLQTNGVPSPIVQTRAPAATPASAASTSRASRMASQKTPRFSPMAAAPPKGKAKASGSLLGKDVIEDTTGWKIVYCDGACRGNGKTAAVAGVGVWWGPGDPRNIAERCPGDQTNNRAELIAIVRILETVPRTTDPLLIRTDSSYSIRCLKEWLKNWRARGYKTSDGKPVKNLGVILYADALLQERKLNGQRVHFEYVKGHAGDAGNEAADYQANLGCERPIEPERDWTALEKVVRERMQKPSGQASKFFEPSATAATTGAAPAPTMSRAEVEDLAQYMTEDPTADLSD
ncbi:ribonuclease H1-like protein [Phanerochaete sordida]|uniref:Ribonuclease H n=1 Tax=Phanerochaete sordida TaxID=48140 RepID=A0A9P3G688_9APHY|nr:ribonuclease H1-like protein [Phanerochaete sordida]